MQGKQVKWSTQESPSQTEHLIPPTPEDPRVPSITLLEGGGGVVCLLLGGKWTGTKWLCSGLAKVPSCHYYSK